MKLEIGHKDPMYPNSDLECACAMYLIWNGKARMYKECTEHKKETHNFVEAIVNSINSGEYQLQCNTHKQLLKLCHDRSNCYIANEVIPIK
jgi:hypothetical protein